MIAFFNLAADVGNNDTSHFNSIFKCVYFYFNSSSLSLFHLNAIGYMLRNMLRC